MKTRATLVDVRFVIICTHNEIYFTNRKLLVAYQMTESTNITHKRQL